MNEATCARAKRAIKAKGHRRKSSWIVMGDKATVGAMCIDCGLSVCVEPDGSLSGDALQIICSENYTGVRIG